MTHPQPYSHTYDIWEAGKGCVECVALNFTAFVSPLELLFLSLPAELVFYMRLSLWLPPFRIVSPCCTASGAEPPSPYPHPSPYHSPPSFPYCSSRFAYWQRGPWSLCLMPCAWATFTNIQLSGSECHCSWTFEHVLSVRDLHSWMRSCKITIYRPVHCKKKLAIHRKASITRNDITFALMTQKHSLQSGFISITFTISTKV